jgi:hypothetical protein
MLLQGFFEQDTLFDTLPFYPLSNVKKWTEVIKNYTKRQDK